MAAILNGSSAHQSFAPLSQSQTVAVCKHLQEQIDALGGRVGNMQMDLRNTSDSLQTFQHAVNSSPFEQSIKESVAHANNAIEANRKETIRNSQFSAKLQGDLEVSSENLTALREGQKVTNVNLQKVIQDLVQTSATTNSLREALEKHVFSDIEKLRDGLGRTNLMIQHLQEEAELRKASLQTQKEEIRGLHSVCQNTRDELAKANTHVHLVEQRCLELANSLRETKRGLEETTEARAKLQDDYDNTKSLVIELQAGFKKVNNVAKQAYDGLETAKMDIHTTRVQLEALAGTLDGTKEGVEQMKIAARALKEGQDRTNMMHSSLANQFEQTRAIVHDTKRELNQTNSLVLPNLHLDTVSACSTATGAPSNASPLSFNSSKGQSLNSSRGASRGGPGGALPKKTVSPGSTLDRTTLGGTAWN